MPPDSQGETLYFMTPVTPYDLADGRDWAEEKQPFLDKVIDTIDGYAPGLRDSIIDSCGVTPYEMSRWTTKGHACHIDMSLSQLGPWRPTPSLAGFRTPIEGLWHASAGSALPSVNGWGGRAAARTILRSSKRGRGRGRASRTAQAPQPRYSAGNGAAPSGNGAPAPAAPADSLR